MRYTKSLGCILWTSVALASISIRRAGWLDRVVEYQKKRFFEDLKKSTFVNLHARIEKAPPGYVDSTDWNYDSVVRLLTLIRDSEGAKPVRAALRRTMQSRRMNFAMSLKNYPSLAKDSPNNFYYNADSGEYYADVDPLEARILEDEDVIVVNNPVEAKLPSARISIRLLRSIMENRAKMARSMPTTKKIIPWSPITKTPATTQISATNQGSSNDTGLQTTIQAGNSSDAATTVAAG